MIKQFTVEQICEHPGFKTMVREYAQLTDPMLPEPKFERSEYHQLESAGLLAVYGATVHQLIVGYAVCLKGRIPHYGASVAIVESIYLMRAYRASGLGLRLIAACEDSARIWGIPQVFFQVHEEQQEILGKVLERRRYSARIRTYGKHLC